MQGPVQRLRWDVDGGNGRWGLLINGEAVDLSVQHSVVVSNTDQVYVQRLTPPPVEVLPQEFALAQNFPNPFNAGTMIRYQLPKASLVEVRLYDMVGQLVRRLVHEQQQAGSYQVVWDGRDSQGRIVGNGVYFYEIRAGKFRALKKMVMTK
jgi:hypothetical protein